MNLKSIIESILFVNEKPLTPQEIAEALDIEKDKALSAIKELQEKYQREGSGLSIVEVAGGYQMCANPENSEWIKKLYKERFKRRLSSASLEVLAIIAYKQPITRLEIEAIRGVNCEQVIKNLAEIGLIKIKGRKQVVGKPFLYGTTRKFLEYFGLNSLEDLPKLEENSLQELKETAEKSFKEEALSEKTEEAS